MANPARIANTSIISSTGFTDCARGLHDGVYGVFRGMVTAALQCVEPYTKKAEQAYTRNYRWLNAGGVVAAGLGIAYACYTPWSSLWSVVTAVPAMYVAHRLTLPVDMADTSDVNGNGSPSPVGSPSVPITPAGVVSDSRLAETTATRLVEIFCALLSNTFRLFDMADDLAEVHAHRLINNLYRGADNYNPELKELEAVMARQYLKRLHFQTLLLTQENAGDISSIVYGGILPSEKRSRFACLCDSERVNYDRLTEHFLAFVNQRRQHNTPVPKEREFLQDQDFLAFLLNKATNAWRIHPRREESEKNTTEVSVCSLSDREREAIVKKLRNGIVDDCHKVKVAIKQGRGC